MKKLVFLLLLIALMLPISSAFAQEEAPFTIGLRRDFGYGNGADIQGRMTISVGGEESRITKVIFLMDGANIAEITTAPFKHSFNTDQYALGTHQLSATVETTDGKSYPTRSLTYRFVSGSEVGEGMKRILIPIGIITLLGMGIPVLLQSTSAKQRQQNPGQPVDYGMSGGAICPKCGYPFARSFLSPHFGVVKLERCPSCKKWSFVGRSSIADLREAELAEARKYGQVFDGADPDKTLKEEKDNLDDTRYTDEV
jgi:hypothetical protein